MGPTAEDRDHHPKLDRYYGDRSDFLATDLRRGETGGSQPPVAGDTSNEVKMIWGKRSFQGTDYAPYQDKVAQLMQANPTLYSQFIMVSKKTGDTVSCITTDRFLRFGKRMEPMPEGAAVVMEMMTDGNGEA